MSDDNKTAKIAKLGGERELHETYYTFITKQNIEEAFAAGFEKGFRWLVIIVSLASGQGGGCKYDSYFYSNNEFITARSSIKNIVTIYENGESKVGFEVFVIDLLEDLIFQRNYFMGIFEQETRDVAV